MSLATDLKAKTPMSTPTDIQFAKPARTPVRTTLVVVASILVLAILAWLLMNPRFEWNVTAQYVFSFPVLRGIGITLLLTVVCMVLGSILGVVLALMRISHFAPFRASSAAFIWFFRAVPMLVQLIFWFNLAYLLPKITMGIPFGPEWFSWDTNSLINPFTAAIIGLSIHESAYMAEIVRSGLLSVDPGQRDAAKAIGYKESTSLIRIILPQALRVIIPPTGSQFISLLKGTSLVSVIGLTDLLHAVQLIYNRTFEIIPLLVTASLWYLVMIGIFSILQSQIEQRLSRGFNRTPAGSKKKIKRPISIEQESV